MTQVSPPAQANSSAPASSRPLGASAWKVCISHLPLPAPQGVFLSFGSELWPRGWGGWSSRGAEGPHQWDPLPALLLAVPSVGFSLIASDVRMLEHCGCCRAGG